jgi:hypothetical protein
MWNSKAGTDETDVMGRKEMEECREKVKLTKK